MEQKTHDFLLLGEPRVDRKTACGLLGMSPSAFERAIKNGDLPQGVFITRNLRNWLLRDLENYLRRLNSNRFDQIPESQPLPETHELVAYQRGNAA